MPAFGPGTGSFFVFLFVRWLGYDFLSASASAKLLNTASNLSALMLFAWKGHVWWHFALAMAVANVLGSVLGTRLALKHGAGFVRGVFIVVVGALMGQSATAIDPLAGYVVCLRLGQATMHLIGTSFWLVMARATFFLSQLALIGVMVWRLLHPVVG